MSVFVFGYFFMLIAGSSLAVYYKRNEALDSRELWKHALVEEIDPSARRSRYRRTP